MIVKSRKCRFPSWRLVLGLVLLVAEIAAPTGAAGGSKKLEFNPQPASAVLKDSRWAQFAVRVLKSDGTLDSTNNKSKITVSLNMSSGSTGVLSGTPVTKTVSAGIAIFALPGDPAVSYNKAETITLKATASDINNYSRLSNAVSVLAPFAVSSVSPVESVVNAPVTSTVKATFNRTVNAATVSASTFYLSPNVSGTYSVSGSTVTFTPSAPLAFSTTYAVTVTMGVKDTYGYPLAAVKTWSFTTAAPPPPAALEFNPQPASPVLANAPWAQFAVRALKTDGTLDAGNNTSQISLSLTSGGTGVLSGTLTKTVAAGVATFTDISFNQAGIVSLMAIASDIASYSKISNFVTVLAPFAATSVNPAENGANVPIATTIAVTFNRPVDVSTVNAATFTLMPNIAGTYSVMGSTATFTPGAPLAYNTLYTATVTTGVKDLNGFALGSAKTWSFTTAAPPPPASLAFNPQPSSPALANNPWTQFAVRALRSNGTVDAGNNTSQITLSLNSGATGVLSGTLTQTVAAGVATFTNVSYSQAASISLKATTPDIPGYSRISGSVTVLAPFAVTSVSPAEAPPVPTNVSVTAYFNRSINAATVNSTTFSLTPSVAGTLSAYGSTIQFTPSAYLPNNTVFTVTITTGVTDTYGYPLATAKIWSFITWNPPPPAWGEPLAISQGSGNDSVSYSWEGGAFLALWQQNSSSGLYGLFSNAMRTPGPWEGVKTLVPPSAMSWGAPATATWAGVTTAVWAGGSYPFTITASNYENGIWNPPQALGPGDMPDVAVGLGTTAVWRTNNTIINASRRPIYSGSFDLPVIISNPASTAYILNQPGVCEDPFTGSAVAVWNENGPGTYNILANRFDGTSWGSPVTVAANASMTSVSGGLPVVCDQFGNATVAWHAMPNGSYNAAPFAARYEANPFPPGNPGWQPPVQIGSDEGSSVPNNQVALAVDGSGAVLAVWSAYNGSVPAGKLLTNWYNPAGGWNNSFTPNVLHAGMTPHYNLVLAFDPPGMIGPAAVVWVEGIMRNVNVSVSNDPASGMWGAPQVVSHPYASNYSSPQVSIEPTGKVRVIWAQSGTIYSAESP